MTRLSERPKSSASPPPARDEDISSEERRSRHKFQTKRLGSYLAKHGVHIEGLRSFVEQVQITAGHRHHAALNADEVAEDAANGFYAVALAVVQELIKSRVQPSDKQLSTIRRGLLCAQRSENSWARLLPIEVGELAVASANHQPTDMLDVAQKLFDMMVEIRYWPGVAHAAQVLLKRFVANVEKRERQLGRDLVAVEDEAEPACMRESLLTAIRDSEYPQLKRSIELINMVDRALAAGDEVFQTKSGRIDFLLTKAEAQMRRAVPGNEKVCIDCWREVGRLGSELGMQQYCLFCELTKREFKLSEILPTMPQSVVDTMNTWLHQSEKEESAPAEDTKGAA